MVFNPVPTCIPSHRALFGLQMLIATTESPKSSTKVGISRTQTIFFAWGVFSQNGSLLLNRLGFNYVILTLMFFFFFLN